MSDVDQLLDRRRLKRRLAAWRLVAVLAIVAFGMALVGHYFDGLRERHVARLDVVGLIVDDPDLLDALDEIENDDNAEALIVRIDSPGGTTVGGEALHDALRRVADKKPVVAVIGTVGASAGYLTAIAAHHIVARESSITGSIGVILQTADLTGLLEKLGIKPESIKSGALKATPSPLEPLTDEARAVTQAIVDDAHRWFVRLVAEGRGLTSEEADRLADGRVYTGRQALANKLIDAIGGEREARQWLEDQREIPASLPVVDVIYLDEETEFLDWLKGMAGKTFLSERLTLDGLVSVWHPELE